MTTDTRPAGFPHGAPLHRHRPVGDGAESTYGEQAEMKKKPSEILIEAARIASDVPWGGRENRSGCGAIDDAGDGWSEKAHEYFRYFAPVGPEVRHGADGWFGNFSFSATLAKERRVLALCLAAAIAKAEGK